MKCEEIYKGRFKYEKDNEWINYGKRILTNKKSRRTNIWTIEAFYLALGCLDINYIENIENKKVLDFGCGNGRSILDFLKVGIKPENIVGIDALPEYIQFGKNMLSEKISLICDDEIKLEENFFDLIHMFSVDQYIEPKERSKIFHQLESVTKKGGYIFIGCNYWGGGELITNYKLAMGRLAISLSRIFPSILLLLSKYSKKEIDELLYLTSKPAKRFLNMLPMSKLIKIIPFSISTPIRNCFFESKLLDVMQGTKFFANNAYYVFQKNG